VWAREPLSDEVLGRLTDVERARLEALRRARHFAGSLGLASSTSYRHLLDTGHDAGLQVVIAAPVDRLEPVTWWFPISGRVAYRAFFDLERAERFAESLRRDGYDTYLRPAALYSTLGWFDDPLPRRVLSWNEAAVIDVALHELVHETIYAPGDSAYNEALATFVAKEATLRLLADQPGLRAEVLRRYADRRRFAALLARLGADLEALYARVDSTDEARRAREPLFQRYRDEVYPSLGWETAGYAGFTSAPLSNAYVVAQTTYLGTLDCFSAWLAELDGDLAGFIALHRETPGQRRDDLPECDGT
jgi:predicted aminopeptidase